MAHPRGLLQLTFHGAERLKNVQLFGKQDPYLTVKVGREEFKTRVHKSGGTNPVWEQSFLFNLDGTADMMHVRVKDSETTIDRMIGRADIAIKDLITKQGRRTLQCVDENDFTKMNGVLNVTVDYTPPGGKQAAASPAPVPMPAPAPVQAAPMPAPMPAPAPMVYAPQPQVAYVQAPPQQPQVVYAASAGVPMYPQVYATSANGTSVYVQQQSNGVPIVLVQQPQQVYGFGHHHHHHRGF